MNDNEAQSGHPVWFLMGPTACGKTDLAIELAKLFPFEVISVDSSMVYKGMDIGTAKPTPEILRQCPHHLIDLREPDNTYSAADFCLDAGRLIGEIIGRGRYPLLVGGTMFYFRMLELGLPDAPPADPKLRQSLETRASLEGWSRLYEELVDLDPVRAAEIRPTDKQRIQRALEIYAQTGQTATAHVAEARLSMGLENMPICKVALAPVERTWLHTRIEQRFEEMLNNGLVQEVDNLLTARGLSRELPALRMVGYRQVIQFLSGELEYNEMVRRGIAATRQLAKRQLTWLRNQSGVTWTNCASDDLLSSVTTYIRSKLVVLGF